MSTQVQCPNCGGYYVETKTEWVDLKSGHDLQFGSGLVLLWAFIGIGSLVLGISALVSRISGSPMSDDWQLICLALPGGLLMTLTLIPLLKTKTIERYYHTCWYCGYRWSRREDEPFPPVTIRPDLIAAGKQRLQDEYDNAVAHQAAEDALKRAGWR